MSQVLVKLQRKGLMVIPRSLREEAGVLEGAVLQVAVVEGGRFLVTPQLTTDPAVAAAPRKNRKRLLGALADTVAGLRREAKAKGLDKIPMREIEAAVEAARRPGKPTKNRSGK
jgi:bifunctional DNA-binding transcriptional regulator/antitoxin component of YhaV-PrlF toxin-antitoxin module